MKFIIGAFIVILIGIVDGKRKEIVLPDQRILSPQDSIKIQLRIQEIEKELKELYQLRDEIEQKIKAYEKNKSPIKIYRPSV